MTDEQVKKGLECCCDDSRTTCSNAEGKGACPYWERFKDQICPIDWCRDAMAKDALALINRLEEEKEQMRKETAKEIFDILEKLEEKGRAILPVGFLFTGRGAYGVEVDK